MIVSARPQDADTLTAIAIAAKRHWNYPEVWIQEWIPSLTISAEYILANEVWMAVEDEKPVGYYSLIYAENETWLDNLWVLPESMGKGIGKALFEHALEKCCQWDVPVLKIEADPNAQRFYEKMGARKVAEHQTRVAGEARILPIMEISL